MYRVEVEMVRRDGNSLLINLMFNLLEQFNDHLTVEQCVHIREKRVAKSSKNG